MARIQFAIVVVSVTSGIRVLWRGPG